MYHIQSNDWVNNLSITITFTKVIGDIKLKPISSEIILLLLLFIQNFYKLILMILHDGFKEKRI